MDSVAEDGGGDGDLVRTGLGELGGVFLELESSGGGGRKGKWP